MPAWKHTEKKWDNAIYYEYRKFVMATAPGFLRRKEDCADLSMMLLVEFASQQGLTLTFQDVEGTLYISKADHAFPHPLIYQARGRADLKWSTKDEYLKIVQKQIQTKSLW